MSGRQSAGRAAGPAAAVLLLSMLMVAACSGGATSAPQGAVPGATAAPAASGAPAASQIAGGQAVPSNAAPGALIIRTGSLELEVADVDAAVVKGRDLVASMGGYVAGSEEADKGDAKVATITYRVPVERWQDAVSGLRAIADKVLHEATAAEEVTTQVVDLDARLANLRASESSLRDIMTRAGTIPDVLAVQDKLTQVREQIERLTAQQKDLTGRAALATLTATWQTPVIAAVTEARSGWDLGREIDRAAAQTIAAAQAAASLLVWLVVVGVPVFGPILLLTALGLVLYRRWAAKRPVQPRQTGWGPPGGGSTMPVPAWATSGAGAPGAATAATGPGTAPSGSGPGTAPSGSGPGTEPSGSAHGTAPPAAGSAAQPDPDRPPAG